MGLRINQNIAAQNAYRNLSVTDGQMAKSLEKLSSGYRINRAADDAAGLAISEGLRSQVGGLKVAVRNAQDGVSMVQTAEGALTEVHSILQRVRDLAVQAGNDSNNGAARANIDTEVTSLVGELDRIADSTNFNGTKLLDGTAGASGTLKFQVGADGDVNSAISVDLTNANVKALSSRLQTASISSGTRFDIADPSLLADGNMAFEVTQGGEVTQVTVAYDADATPTVQELANQLNSNTAFAANFSASVNKDANGMATGITVRAHNGGTITTTSPDGGTALAVGVAGGGSVGLSFVDHASAQNSVVAIDAEIRNVSTARANLGALQNRFEHTINNINVAVENLSASESRIRDTDMAQEMMSFTRAQILSQAGTAMLSQANQAPQGVLQLLR